MRNLDRTYSEPSCEQGGVQKAQSTTSRILKCGNSRYYNIHIRVHKHYKVHKKSSILVSEVQRRKTENGPSNCTQDLL